MNEELDDPGTESNETVIWETDEVGLSYNVTEDWPYTLLMSDRAAGCYALSEDEIVALRDALSQHLLTLCQTQEEG